MKPIKLPAKLCLDDKEFEIKGTISVKDGLFLFDNPDDRIFAYNAFIEFIFNEQKHRFAAKNLGGKYFVSNYKDDLQYQKFTVLATLQEVLSKKELKKDPPKAKV